MRKDARYWVDTLGLSPHPEGGYYREIYRSEDTLPKGSLPGRFGSERSVATSIYYLLEGEAVSRFHRIRSDELWHFYAGTALTLVTLGANGVGELPLGPQPDGGEVFQQLVRAGVWFGAALDAPFSNGAPAYALVGCTVAPGFHYDDFELADRRTLLETYPHHAELIERFTG